MILFNLDDYSDNVALSPLAKKLRRLRRLKGVTIEQAAIEAGISPQDLFNYEHDKLLPTETVTARLFELYK